MKSFFSKSNILISSGFLISLILLLCNDFILKDLFHNWFTGKLSDFAGLFVFPLFWYACFSRNRKAIFLITGLGFVFWKTPYADFIIDWWNSIAFYSINRVVDYTDYLALSILPVAFWYSTNFKTIPKLSHSYIKTFVLALSCFSFLATQEYKVERRLFHHRGGGIYCDEMNTFCKKEIKTSTGKKFLFTNPKGEVIGDSLLYDEIQFLGSSSYTPSTGEMGGVRFKVKKENKYGVIDIHGVQVFPIEYDAIKFEGGLCRYTKNDTTFLAYSYGNIFSIEDTMIHQILINDSMRVLTNLHDHISYLVDDKGNRLSPFAFTDARYFIHPHRYGNSFEYYQVMSPFGRKIKSGYTVFSNQGICYEGLTMEELNESNQFRHTSIIRLDDSITLFAWKEKGIDLYFDEMILDYKLESRLHLFKKNNQWGIVEHEGKIILNPRYDRILPYSENFAGFQSSKTKLYGFLNKNGKVAIAPRFTYVGSFKNGTAPVQVETDNDGLRFGYIDKKGKMVIKPIYEEAFNFDKDEWAIVKKGVSYFYMYKDLKSFNRL